MRTLDELYAERGILNDQIERLDKFTERGFKLNFNQQEELLSLRSQVSAITNQIHHRECGGEIFNMARKVNIEFAATSGPMMFRYLVFPSAALNDGIRSSEHFPVIVEVPAGTSPEDVLKYYFGFDEFKPAPNKSYHVVPYTGHVVTYRPRQQYDVEVHSV